MAVERLEQFCIDDVVAVAHLHRRVFHHKEGPPSSALIAYYRQIFFENPWRSDDVPSLLWRDSAGAVSGFMGMILRPMLCEGQPIRVSVGHRLMVDRRASNAAFVAARLVRACLSGKQDLFLADGVGDLGRRVVLAAGGVSVPQYSMKWICPISPVAWFPNFLFQRSRLGRVAGLVARSWRVLHRVTRGRSRRFESHPNGAIGIEPISDEILLESICRSSAKLALKPSYDLGSLQWLLAVIRADPARGKLNGFALRGRGGVVGSCLYYANAYGGYEVIVIAGEGPAETRELLFTLIDIAYREGATCVFGRFEPRLAEPLWELQCYLKPSRGCGTVVYSSTQRLVELVQMGDVFLSNLDGELWLGVPMSYDD